MKIELLTIYNGRILKRTNPPDNRPIPLTNITSAPPQANCSAGVARLTSANSDGTQFPNVTIEPKDRAWYNPKTHPSRSENTCPKLRDTKSTEDSEGNRSIPNMIRSSKQLIKGRA